MTNCGIYIIRHKQSHKCYVGQASDINRRWSRHRLLLNRGCHHCLYLQASWNKFGEEAFEFIILELCAKEHLTDREQYWLDVSKSIGIYNSAPVAGSILGWKATPEQRKRNSEALKGNTNASGWRPTEEQLLKMSLAKKGKPSPMQGKKHTEESKEKMRISTADQIFGPRSEETKRRISIGRTGILHSEEAKQRMSESAKNRPRTFIQLSKADRIKAELERLRKLREDK